MRLGLLCAAAACLYVSVTSWVAGYTTEVAVLRGLVAFILVSAIAYVAELLVATAPPPKRPPVERHPHLPAVDPAARRARERQLGAAPRPVPPPPAAVDAPSAPPAPERTQAA